MKFRIQEQHANARRLQSSPDHFLLTVSHVSFFLMAQVYRRGSLQPACCSRVGALINPPNVPAAYRNVLTE
jgi:hypothetical protein